MEWGYIRTLYTEALPEGRLPTPQAPYTAYLSRFIETGTHSDILEQYNN